MTNWVASFFADHPEYAALPVYKRAKHAIHFRLPDGRIESLFTGKPIHYEATPGNWQALDTTLQALAGNNFAAPGVPVTINRNGTISIDGSLWSQRVARVGILSDTTFVFTPIISLGNGTATADKLNRSSGDFTHTIQITEDGARETLTVLAKQALPVSSDWICIESTITGRSFADGWLDEFDDSGFHFPTPTVTDANGATAECRRYAKTVAGVQFIYTGVRLTFADSAAYPVVIDPDFTGTTADGFINGSNATYSTARSTSATLDVASTSFSVGQNLGATSLVYRAFLAFDTSSLDDAAVIDQVNLKLMVLNDNSATDFDVQVVKQDWSAQNPLTSGNQEAAYDNCLAGTADIAIWRNTASIADGTAYAGGNLDTTWVNKTGTTYYSLRSSRDLSSTAPSGLETVDFAAADHPTAGSRPVLSVYYFAAPTVTAISPAVGQIGGGLAVTITGTDFYGAPRVSIGGAPCTSIVVVNATTTSITAITGAKPVGGTFDVTVTTAKGTGTLTNGFVYSAFPQVIDADTKTSTVIANSTSWTLTYPTNIQAGDVLLAFAGTDGNPTLTWPSPWVSLGVSTNGACEVGAAYKLALGTETGTFTLGLGATEQGAWRIYRVHGSYPTQVPEVALTGAGGASANPDPPNLDPAGWGTESTLWIAACGVDTSRTISVYPYTGRNTADVSGGSTGATLGLCTKENLAASENPGTFTISASDDWGVLTVAVRPAPGGVSVGDSAVLTDTPTVAVIAAGSGLSVNVTDSATLADTPTVFLPERLVSKSESVTVAETLTLMVESTVNKSDSATLTDAPTVNLQSDVRGTDSASVADTPTVTVTVSISASDSATVAATPSLLLPQLYASAADSATVSDSPTVNLQSDVRAIDSITATDTPAVAVPALGGVNVSDSTSLAETRTLDLSVAIAATDSASSTDTPTVAIAAIGQTTISVSDSASLSDAPIVSLGVTISASDSASVAEAVTLLIPQLYITAAESAATTDTPTVSLQVAVSATDSATVTDTPALLIPQLYISAADSASLTDTTNIQTVAPGQTLINVTDTTALTDTPTLLLGVTISKSESVTVSETLTRQVESAVSKTESATVTDATTVAIPALGAVSVSDSTTVTDTPAALPLVTIAASDSVSTGETVSRQLESTVSKSESVTLTDAPSVASFLAGVNVNDSTALSEAMAFALNPLLLFVTDSIAASDTPDVYVGPLPLTLAMSESATVLDSPGVLVNAPAVTYDLSLSENITLAEFLTLTRVDATVVPESRSYFVAYENRTLAILFQSRTLSIARDARTFEPPFEDRTLTVARDIRVFTIEE